MPVLTIILKCEILENSGLLSKTRCSQSSMAKQTVSKNGNWSAAFSNKMAYNKTELQCRDRFLNFTNPQLKRGRLTQPEIALLFQCYNQSGSCWSLFEDKITGRAQNKLKNQFYSSLRSLLRLILKIWQRKNLCPFKIKTRNFKAKFLIDLYQGRKEFHKFKNFLKNCLEATEYSIKRTKLQQHLKNHNTQYLRQFYRQIFIWTREREREADLAGQQRKWMRKQASTVMEIINIGKNEFKYLIILPRLLWGRDQHNQPCVLGFRRRKKLCCQQIYLSVLKIWPTSKLSDEHQKRR